MSYQTICRLAVHGRALLRSYPAGRDIALAVTAKLLLLGALQAVCFSHPAAPDMKLQPEQVARALFASTPAIAEPRHDR